MSPEEVDRAQVERRHRRAAWPVRAFRLGEEPSDDLSATTTGEERLAMVWPMTIDAFSSAGGLPRPTPRNEWPVRIRSLGDSEVG